MLLIFCSEIDSLIDNKLLCLKRMLSFFPFTGVFENNRIFYHYVCYYFVFCYWHLFCTSYWAIVEKSYQNAIFSPLSYQITGIYIHLFVPMTLTCNCIIHREPYFSKRRGDNKVIVLCYCMMKINGLC